MKGKDVLNDTLPTQGSSSSASDDEEDSDSNGTNVQDIEASTEDGMGVLDDKFGIKERIVISINMGHGWCRRLFCSSMRMSQMNLQRVM